MMNFSEFQLFEKRMIGKLTFEEFDEVIDFVIYKHWGQVRKFSGNPYIYHPARVAKMAYELTNNDDLCIASFLHDVLEDTETSWKELKDRFGDHVAKVVQELTSNEKKIKKMLSVTGDKTLAKAQYLLKHMLGMSDDALVIKLIDRLDNLQDLEKDNQNALLKKAKETWMILKNLINLRKLNNIQLTVYNKILEIVEPLIPQMGF